MNIRDDNVYSEVISMIHCTLVLSNTNNFNLITPILTVTYKNIHILEQLHSLILYKWVNRGQLFHQGGILLVWYPKEGWYFFLVIFHKERLFPDLFMRTFNSFTNVIWGYGLSVRLTSICKTTDMTWSNLDQIYSKSILW